MKLRRYSPRTRRAYLKLLRRFLADTPLYIQELLGHASTATIQIYTHMTRRDLVQIRSPLDVLEDRRDGVARAPRPSLTARVTRPQFIDPYV